MVRACLGGDKMNRHGSGSRSAYADDFLILIAVPPALLGRAEVSSRHAPNLLQLLTAVTGPNPAVVTVLPLRRSIEARFSRCSDTLEAIVGGGFDEAAGLHSAGRPCSGSAGPYPFGD